IDGGHIVCTVLATYLTSESHRPSVLRQPKQHRSLLWISGSWRRGKIIMANPRNWPERLGCRSDLIVRSVDHVQNAGQVDYKGRREARRPHRPRAVVARRQREMPP